MQQRNADESLAKQGFIPIEVVSVRRRRGRRPEARELTCPHAQQPLWVTKSQDLQTLQT